MLKELWIRHFAIIEEIKITFDKGFHVITGETGAGKSILIDALGLVIGARASTEFVRHGEKKAEIEAVFELSDDHPARSLLTEWGMELEDEDILVIRREITSSGKSTCRINGRVVTLSMLKQLGAGLLDISGQHEHQSLLSSRLHLEWIDQFGGEDILSTRSLYQKYFLEYRKLVEEREKLNLNQKEVNHRIDLLKFQLEEIDAASLTIGEDEELIQERNKLAHAEKLMHHTSKAYNHFYGEHGGLDQMQEALAHLEQISEIDEEVKSLVDTIQTAYYQLEEGAREVARYRDELEFDPERLYEVEERLHLIRHLKRKYGDSIEEILNYRSEIQSELEKLEALEETTEHLDEQIKQVKEKMLEIAKELTAKRKQVASLLESRVEQELKDLNMASTVFHVAFYPDPYRNLEFHAHGLDEVEFLISPNPGEPLKPLTKIASGGELSRIMLALKCIFTDFSPVHTLVFDEIDTGVSGRAAQAIAEKIAVVSSKHQVLCVTHLPQVACMADHHFYIKKETSSDQTRTCVQKLDDSGRLMELARMLGGVEVTETTLEHAEEMIRLAQDVKGNIHN